MILIALSLVFSLIAALGVAGPTAAGAVSAGHASLEAVAVQGAARGTLASWYEGDWVDSTSLAPPGTRLSFEPIDLPGGIEVERSLEGVLSNVWLLAVRAVRLDQGGRVRAALRRGWLVRWGRNPGDSVASRGVLSRYEVDGFE